MRKRSIGKLEVSAIGLGCMGMSNGFGNPKDEKEMCDLMALAFNSGITLFDTAEAYGAYQNEELVGKGIKPFRNQIILATKCGMKMTDLKNNKTAISSDPQVLRSSLEDSLNRLQTDVIDLYYLHRVDPNVPVEIVAELMHEFYNEGKIRAWGISDSDPKTIQRADDVFHLSAVQTQYNIMYREVEKELLPLLKEREIALVCNTPLAKGFLTGTITTETRFGENDSRAHYSRFQKENILANQVLIDLIQEIAERKHASIAQISLAWLLAQGSNVIPIPGTTNPARLKENISATDIEFTEEESSFLRQALNKITIAGGFL